MRLSSVVLVMILVFSITLFLFALYQEDAKRGAQTPPKPVERVTYEGSQNVGDYRWTFWYDHKYQSPIACVQGPGIATVCVKE